jgi:hypothetical protein
MASGSPMCCWRPPLRTVTWLGIAAGFNCLITQLYREFFPELHQ